MAKQTIPPGIAWLMEQDIPDTASDQIRAMLELEDGKPIPDVVKAHYWTRHVAYQRVGSPIVPVDAVVNAVVESGVMPPPKPPKVWDRLVRGAVQPGEPIVVDKIKGKQGETCQFIRLEGGEKVRVYYEDQEYLFDAERVTIPT